MPHAITDVTDWSDFDWFLNEYLPKQTIPTLRSFGVIIENTTSVWLGFRSQERKGVLLDKITQSLQTLQTKSDFSNYRTIRQSCERLGTSVRNSGIPQPPPNIPPPTFGGVPHPSSMNARWNNPLNNPLSPGTGGFGAHAGPSRMPVLNSSGWPATNTNASAYNRPVHTLLDWKLNPMWKPLQAITAVEMLPDILAADNNHVRKEKRANFILQSDVIEKLQTSRANPLQAPHYSLRLFATSSEHYRPPNAGFQAGSMSITNRNIPIEFPTNPDVVVDDVPLAFKDRGLRGKAGSAPPFDLGKAKVTPGGSDWRAGRMVAVNFAHTGPTTGKKKEGKRFWFQVVLAEMTTKEELLAKLMKLVPTPAEEIIAKARAKAEADEDIVAGTSIMSFKDPLSYMRITRPIRSSKCAHIQCFDAIWWIESNSQHPQWQCPLCSKELKFDDLIVDGYFSSILNACPEEVDQVVLESDLEWHTENGKFGSKTWIAQNPPSTITKEATKPNGNGTARTEREPSRSVKPEITPPGSPAPDPKGKRKAIEILSDSDDDEAPSRSSNTNGHVEQPFRPPPASRLPSTSSTAPPTTGVIDLTLDSSDEEDDPPPPAPIPRSSPPSTTSSMTTATSQGFHPPDVVEGGLRVPPLQPPILPNHTSTLQVPNIPPFGYSSLATRLANPSSSPVGVANGGGIYDVRRTDEGQQALPSRSGLGSSGAGRDGLSGRLSREDPLTGGHRNPSGEYRGYGAAVPGRYAGDHWEPEAEQRERWDEQGYRGRERERSRERDRPRDRDRAVGIGNGGQAYGYASKGYREERPRDRIDNITTYSSSTDSHPDLTTTRAVRIGHEGRPRDPEATTGPPAVTFSASPQDHILTAHTQDSLKTTMQDPVSARSTGIKMHGDTNTATTSTLTRDSSLTSQPPVLYTPPAQASDSGDWTKKLAEQTLRWEEWRILGPLGGILETCKEGLAWGREWCEEAESHLRDRAEEVEPVGIVDREGKSREEVEPLFELAFGSPAPALGEALQVLARGYDGTTTVDKPTTSLQEELDSTSTATEDVAPHSPGDGSSCAVLQSELDELLAWSLADDHESTNMSTTDENTHSKAAIPTTPTAPTMISLALATASTSSNTTTPMTTPNTVTEPEEVDESAISPAVNGSAISPAVNIDRANTTAAGTLPSQSVTTPSNTADQRVSDEPNERMFSRTGEETTNSTGPVARADLFMGTQPNAPKPPEEGRLVLFLAVLDAEMGTPEESTISEPTTSSPSTPKQLIPFGDSSTPNHQVHAHEAPDGIDLTETTPEELPEVDLHYADAPTFEHQLRLSTVTPLREVDACHHTGKSTISPSDSSTSRGSTAYHTPQSSPLRHPDMDEDMSFSVTLSEGLIPSNGLGGGEDVLVVEEEPFFDALGEM